MADTMGPITGAGLAWPGLIHCWGRIWLQVSNVARSHQIRVFIEGSCVRFIAPDGCRAFTVCILKMRHGSANWMMRAVTGSEFLESLCDSEQRICLRWILYVATWWIRDIVDLLD